MYLSVDLNSDGAPTIKSRQLSLWNILCRVFELNQSCRDKFDNVIILGAWLHQSKPVKMFYEKSIEQLANLKDSTVTRSFINLKFLFDNNFIISI